MQFDDFNLARLQQVQVVCDDLIPEVVILKKSKVKLISQTTNVDILKVLIARPENCVPVDFLTLEDLNRDCAGKWYIRSYKIPVTLPFSSTWKMAS